MLNLYGRLEIMLHFLPAACSDWEAGQLLQHGLQQVKVKMWLSLHLFLTPDHNLTTSLLTRHFPGPEFYYSGSLFLSVQNTYKNFPPSLRILSFDPTKKNISCGCAYRQNILYLCSSQKNVKLLFYDIKDSILVIIKHTESLFQWVYHGWQL